MTSRLGVLDRLPQRVREVARALVDEWRKDRVDGLAAEVAFFALLSIFPALVAVAAGLGGIEAIIGGDLAGRAEVAVTDFLQRVLTDDADRTVAAVEDLFRTTSPGVLTIGSLLALWAASRGFAAVINALDVVYDLDDRRSYVRRRLLALGLATGTVVVLAVLLAMVIVGPLLGSGRSVAEHLGLGDAFALAWDWVRWPVVAAVAVLWAAAIFHLAPSHRTPWRHDLPGALLTASLWVLLSLAFRGYLLFAGTANQVLGTLGGALIVLLWLYLLALGLLVGGELNAVLLVRRDRSAAARPGVADP